MAAVGVAVLAALMIFQVPPAWTDGLTTTALAFVLIFGPGVLWARRETSPLTRLILLLGAGPLALNPEQAKRLGWQ